MLTVTTDTTLITSAGQGIWVTPDVAGAGIRISGITGTFTHGEHVFASQILSWVGITDSVLDDLLDGSNGAISEYNLGSGIGPLPLTITHLAQFVDVPTSLGSVTFSSVSGVTFQATPGLPPSAPQPTAAPVLVSPAAILALICGLAGFGLYQLRGSRT